MVLSQSGQGSCSSFLFISDDWFLHVLDIGSPLNSWMKKPSRMYIMYPANIFIWFNQLPVRSSSTSKCLIISCFRETNTSLDFFMQCCWTKFQQAVFDESFAWELGGFGCLEKYILLEKKRFKSVGCALLYSSYLLQSTDFRLPNFVEEILDLISYFYILVLYWGVHAFGNLSAVPSRFYLHL